MGFGHLKDNYFNRNEFQNRHPGTKRTTFFMPSPRLRINPSDAVAGLLYAPLQNTDIRDVEGRAKFAIGHRLTGVPTVGSNGNADEE